MPVTKDQVDMLTALACAVRPRNAPRWDERGTHAAIDARKHLALDEVILDVIACAMDPEAKNPGVIGKLGWRNRLLRVAGEPLVERVEPALHCASCGQPEGDCRTKRAHDDDHRFVPVGAARAHKRPAEAARLITEDLRSRIRPLGDRPEESTHE